MNRRRMNIAALGLVVLFGLLCCGGARLDYPLVAAKTDAGVRVSGSLQADPETGRFYLRLQVNNASPGMIRAEWGMVRLHTDAGLMNLPLREVTDTTEIAAGEKATYELEFHPVNDGLVYQKIGRKGSFCPEYRVDLSFLKNNTGVVLFNEPLSFRAIEAGYRDYGKKHANRILFYSFVPDRKAFEERHLAYWAGMEKKHADHDHHAGPPPSLFISGEELMLSQVLLKLVPYRMGGRLYAFLKLVNRSDGLLLDTAGIILKAGGREYRPVNGFSAVKGPDMKVETPSRLAMTRNARLEFHFDFGPVPDAAELVLALPGLLADNKKPLFALEFPYRQSAGNQ